MTQNDIDLGATPVGRLFGQYFIPTLLGMVSMCFVTMADGIFVGRFVGPAGVAAVNIVWAPMMLLIGLGLMLGIGCSVVASIRLAHGETERARKAV
ncbi:MAG: MATE family efflux transporter, partial [Duncaniella sp.]|nr:MATE family efflux transporter [Duncaniella sp.]